MNDVRSDATHSPFIYLLNAMEAAAQSPNPFIEKYAEKRKAVLEYVEKLEAAWAAKFDRENASAVSETSAPVERNAIIEECAKVAVNYGGGRDFWAGGGKIAEAIRALKNPAPQVSPASEQPPARESEAGPAAAGPAPVSAIQGTPRDQAHYYALRIKQITMREHSMEEIESEVRFAIEASREALRSATLPSQEVILKLVYEYFKDDATRRKLLRTVWKDSIDIDEPNYSLKEFCAALIRATVASPDRTGADHG